MMPRLILLAFLVAALPGLAHPATAAQTDAPEAPTTATAVTEVAKGLENPWGLQFLPDGRALVTERPGRMRVVDMDGKLSAPIAGMPNVVQGGQAGMLDVLLAPDFSQSGLIYFSYSEPRGFFKNGTSVVRAKLTLTDDGGAISDGVVIFRQEPAFSGRYHFGSRLVWAKDGALFITTGERASQRDLAQDLSTQLGKVIRINADGSVPKDNPYVGQKGKQPEIWSYGHRNMQGAALNPATGELWTTEHGAQGGDELNVARAGKNYGWPLITWGEDYGGGKIGEGASKPGLEQPVYYWVPSIATSGLAFYTGDLFPAWKGNLLVGGLAGAVLERLVLDGETVVGVERLLTDRGDRVRDVRVGPDGAVYVLTDATDGKLLRIAPAN
ncbi:MAG: PQQ-dependent sugar dehydrogenase [Hyphomicrobium sp.]